MFVFYFRPDDDDLGSQWKLFAKLKLVTDSLSLHIYSMSFNSSMYFVYSILHSHTAILCTVVCK